MQDAIVQNEKHAGQEQVGLEQVGQEQVGNQHWKVSHSKAGVYMLVQIGKRAAGVVD